MKLVVSWDYSDCDCSGTETVCVKAPSVSGLKGKLEEALKKYLVEYEVYQGEVQKWSEKLRRLSQAYEKVKRSKRKGPEALAKMEDHRLSNKNIHRPDGAFHVGSHVFCLEAFVRYDDDYRKRSHLLPEIQTLEEWFESKCKD